MRDESNGWLRQHAGRGSKPGAHDTFPNLVALTCAFALTCAACTSAPTISTCVPGHTESCACPGGILGVQECDADGHFAACQCPAADDAATGVDASSDTDGGMETDGSIALDGAADPDGATAADADAPADAAAADAATIHGHVVLMGSNLGRAEDSWDRLFANAIFLSERSGDLRVLEYTQYSAGSGWEDHPRAVMDDAATSRGRTLVRTALTSAPGLAGALATADVLFVPVQPYADDATMRGVASFWHDPIVSFVDSGGVVVVAGAELGSNGGFEFRVVEAADLFVFGVGGSRLPSETVPIAIVDASDPVAAGVLSTFPTGLDRGQCFPSSARGNLVARTADSALCPVVRHLVR